MTATAAQRSVPHLVTPRLTIRPMREEDVTQAYADALNDRRIHRFLSCPPSGHTIDACREYVRGYIGREDAALLGVFVTDTRRHIGNITFSTIDEVQRHVTLGIALLDAATMGHGYASEALDGVCRFVFDQWRMSEVRAGVAMANHASERLFARCGFEKVGIQTDSGIQHKRWHMPAWLLSRRCPRERDDDRPVFVTEAPGDRVDPACFQDDHRVYLLWPHLTPARATQEALGSSLAEQVIGESGYGQRRWRFLTVRELGCHAVWIKAQDAAFDLLPAAREEMERQHPGVRRRWARLLDRDDLAEAILDKHLLSRLGGVAGVLQVSEALRRRFGPDVAITYQPRTAVRTREALRYVPEDRRTSSQVMLRLHAGGTDAATRPGRCIAGLAAQAMLSTLAGLTPQRRGKAYRYGVVLISPHRQLGSEHRNLLFWTRLAGWGVGETCVVNVAPLSVEQRRAAEQSGLDVHDLPRPTEPLPLVRKWWRLLWESVGLRRDAALLHEVAASLYRRAAWEKLLGRVGIGHVMTHADFGAASIARMEVFDRRGTTCWYYADSANMAANLHPLNQPGGRSPQWAHLPAHHVLAWDAAMAAMFQSHPGHARVHVAGCPWRTKNGPSRAPEATERILGVFPSTYACDGITSIGEGIVFLQDLLEFLDSHPRWRMVIKSKHDLAKDRAVAGVWASALDEVTDRLLGHARVTVAESAMEAGELSRGCDVVVGFPFTSPVREAGASGVPGFWYDPLNEYRGTRPSQMGQVAHDFAELVARLESMEVSGSGRTGRNAAGATSESEPDFAVELARLMDKVERGQG